MHVRTAAQAGAEEGRILDAGACQAHVAAGLRPGDQQIRIGPDDAPMERAVQPGQALDVSVDFLMGGQVQALEAVEFRKHSATSARDRAHAEVLVTEQLENYLAIESILELEPAADPFGGVRTEQDPELRRSRGVAGRRPAETLESRRRSHPQHDRPAGVQGHQGDRSRPGRTLRRLGLHRQARPRPARYASRRGLQPQQCRTPALHPGPRAWPIG